jgi:hypothetical protein
LCEYVGVYILQTPNNISEHTEETLSKDNLIFSNQDKDVLIEFKDLIEYELPKNFVPPIIPKSDRNEEKEQIEKESQESSEKSSSEKKLERKNVVFFLIFHSICNQF